MAMFMVKPWYKKSGSIESGLYGVEWNYTTGTTSCTRTDDAVNFSAPNPQYFLGNNKWSVGSSPFDNIMPWAGIRRVTDADAGELVEIPKFWYKWSRGEDTKILRITSDPTIATQNNMLVSPAHADRGDGVGERDYVYIGRYHCSTNDYKSTRGVKPKASITRDTARTNIHNLGTNIWQMDYAMWWTVNMLYLVEFADWNSQAKIGYGCGNGSSTENSGASDSMTYHTGTTKSDRTTPGVGIQYRHIEDWWANVCDWCDGIFFKNINIYCLKNPSNFTDYSYSIGNFVGERKTNSGFIKGFGNPYTTGFEYAIYPLSIDDSLDGSTYVTDYYYYSSVGVVLRVGGYYVQSPYFGAFYWDCGRESYNSNTQTGCRLMVLPSSQLS